MGQGACCIWQGGSSLCVPCCLRFVGPCCPTLVEGELYPLPSLGLGGAPCCHEQQLGLRLPSGLSLAPEDRLGSWVHPELFLSPEPLGGLPGVPPQGTWSSENLHREVVGPLGSMSPPQQVL